MGLLAFAKPSYPKAPPEIVDQVNSLGLLAALAIAVYLLARLAWVRNLVLGREDPRMFALFRIGLAYSTFICFLNLRGYARMLWSDEGLFFHDMAVGRYGRASLAGWIPGEGLLDPWPEALRRFFWGKTSLFWVDSSPSFVELHLTLLSCLLLLFALGFRTRITAVACWLLVRSIYSRSALYLEGTDTVFVSLWFIFIFVRSGEAWSVDSLLRRKLAARAAPHVEGGRVRAGQLILLLNPLLSCLWGGLLLGALFWFLDHPLSSLLGPALGCAVALGLRLAWGLRHPHVGLNAGPRAVPRWPRLLVMGQMACIYVTTGVLKTGAVWRRGDALYYALNMDHFYRFEGVTQQVSHYLGTNLFRLATWIVHYWEMGFAAVLLGVWLAWAREESRRGVKISKAMRLLGWLSLAVLWLSLWKLATLAYPYWMALDKAGDMQDATEGLRWVNAFWSTIVPLSVVAWWLAGRVPGLKTRAQGGWWPGFMAEAGWLQEQLRAWLLGRRLWLGLGLAFHLNLLLFMNLGMFPGIMMLGYLGFFSARPLLALGRVLCRRWKLGRLEAAFAPLEGPSRVDPAPVHPPTQILVALAVVIAATGAVGVQLGWWQISAHGEWPIRDLLAAVLAGLSVLGLGALAWERRRYGAARGRSFAPAAFHRLVAIAVVAFSLWHAGAVLATLAPTRPVLSRWRSKAGTIFGGWLRGTGTNQSWAMFAPNPPRSNSFMQTLIVDKDGEEWDLGDSAFEERPNPFWINDRLRKMQRRMMDKGKWYIPYWADYQCREWELEEGEPPVEIRVVRIRTKMPPPEKAAVRPWHPRRLSAARKELQTATCRPEYAISAEMRRRRGQEPSPEEIEREAKLAEKSAKDAERRRESWLRDRQGAGSARQPIDRPGKP